MNKGKIVLTKGEANVSCGSTFGHPHSAGEFT